jgi:Putative peptidoglycan binding domain
MNYKVFILSLLFLFIECSKPISLRSANNAVNEDQRARSASTDFPPNPKSGHCFVKAVVPAEYKTVEEKVLVSNATTKVEEVPAVIETIEEKTIDQPGSSTWKKSEDGLLYCYDEIPPTYKTVRRDVVKSPAYNKSVEVPAEYKIVKKQELVKEARNEWTEVLCGNNARPAIIEKIQKSLKANGYAPGRSDGQLDQETMEALNNYQKDNKLKVNKDGFINMETVESLGVQL